MSRKYTLAQVQQEFIDRDLIPLFDEYNGNNEVLLAKTQEGYIINISLSNLKSNRTPRKFSIYNTYTIQNIKLWCKLNNKSLELLDKQEYKGNKEKLKWKCLKDDCGEIFFKSWDDIYNNESCSYCTGYYIGLSNCLATKNPKLASEWHPTKNGDLTPYDVVYTNYQKVWWQCSKNPEHEWQATISSRNNGCGCPYCYGRYPTKDYNLLTCNPKLCEEWNYKRNKKKPEEYCPNSGDKVWWICEKGHEWQSTIYNRSIGNGCPYCIGKLPSKEYNLLVINPELCEEWNCEKNNKKPEEYTPGSNQKVWWKCKKCGYEWKATICGRNNTGQGCPHCNKSKGEKEISKILMIFRIDNIYHHTFPDCKYKKPLEFDFYLSNHIIAIEYQGIQHYEPIDFANKGKEWALKQFNLVQLRDQIKRDYCKNNNIKLIEIPYWDFDNIEEILKRELMINNE
ncbi:MAG: hypothetical protein LLF98_02075 [Clostridium sp.]|uniref:zinc-ribbon domain-containing protein n=1 Tax=Clostridium sp. TaxID=1506 RepID=UPI0025C09E8F|nr:zinc-ribbon domain-containing protein [Clostridium sp.]MCE5220069.1 hypothetical protein [Clostridium sp.]